MLVDAGSDVYRGDGVARSRSWADVRAALDDASEGTKGEASERLVKAYLMLDARYDFKNVWNTDGEVPKPILKRLTSSTGI